MSKLILFFSIILFCIACNKTQLEEGLSDKVFFIVSRAPKPFITKTGSVSNVEQIDSWHKEILSSYNDLLKDSIYVMEIEESNPLVLNSPSTRASSSIDNSINGIKVYGYKWDSNQEFSSNAERFIHGIYLDKASGNIYKTNILWPNSSKKVRFFAIANSKQYALSDDATKLDVTLSTANVKDLLFASTGPITPSNSVKNANVSLSFQHVLTGLRFESNIFKTYANNLPKYNKYPENNTLLKGKITKIVFKNIKKSAKYDFSDLQWKDYGDDVTVEYDLSSNPIVIDGLKENMGKALYPANMDTKSPLFYVLPQAFSDKSSMDITYQLLDDDGLPHDVTLSVSLANVKPWVKGKIVTYKLSNTKLVKEPEFEVLINDIPLDDDLENLINRDDAAVIDDIPSEGVIDRPALNMVLKSYMNIKYTSTSRVIVKNAAPWKVSYSTNGKDWEDSAPSFTAGLPSGGYSIGEYRPNGPFSFYAQTETNTATKYLRTVTERGTRDKPIDLSYRYTKSNETTKVRNTANCYMITAPGWYMIPLVYGNAIKNDAINERSYKAKSPGSERNISPEMWLENFIRHDGKNIEGPWIVEDNSITVDSGTELWGDSKESYIEQIKIKKIDGHSYILFHVDKDRIEQGSSLIAAKSGSVIVWSWHLWIMPNNIYDEIILADNGNYFPYPLGWKDDEGKLYPKRNVYMRFTQNETGKTLYAKIRQKPKWERSNEGRATYYQGGRKDPFPAKGTDVHSIVERGTHGSGGDYYYTIQYPTYFRIGDRKIAKEYWYNYWNNDNDKGRLNSIEWARSNLYSTKNINVKEYKVSPKDKGMYGWRSTPIKTVYDPSPAGYVVPNPTYLERNKVRIWEVNPGIGYLNPETGNIEGYVKKGGKSEGSIWSSFISVPSEGGSNWRFVGAALYNSNYDTYGNLSVMAPRYLNYGFAIFPMRDSD